MAQSSVETGGWCSDDHTVMAVVDESPGKSDFVIADIGVDNAWLSMPTELACPLDRMR